MHLHQTNNNRRHYWPALGWSSQCSVLLRSSDILDGLGSGVFSCAGQAGHSARISHRKALVQRVLQRLSRLPHISSATLIHAHTFLMLALNRSMPNFSTMLPTLKSEDDTVTCELVCVLHA